jgi:mono/diheme cytochrome c family protein
MTTGPSRAWLLAIAAVLAAGSIVLHWLNRFDPERRNVTVFTEMAYSVAHESNAVSPVHVDRRVVQLPPWGTIPRGLMPLHFAASAEDAARAGDELLNPYFRGEAPARARGQVVYETFCVPCHGADGAGRGKVVERGFPPPPSLLAERAKGMRDGQIFHVITYGQRSMPSYAAQVERDDRWKAIVYLRALQEGAP